MTNLNDRLIILGSDPHTIKEAAVRGLPSVIVRDLPSHLRGGEALPPGSVEVVVESVADPTSVWAGLLRSAVDAATSQPIGVVTANEFALGSAALLSERFRLRGPDLNGVVTMRDKYLQKQRVREHGVPVTKARVVVPGSTEPMNPGIETASGVLIIKPLAGASAADVTKVTSEDEYAAALQERARAGRGPVLVEDWVDVAAEFCVDGLLLDGRVIFISVGQYNKPALAYTRRNGSPSADAYRIARLGPEEEGFSAATALAIQALEALDYTEGIFHMEVLQEAGTGRLLFSECAARRGGAMIQEAVQAKHGISLAGIVIDIAVGRIPTIEPTTTSRCVSSTYLHLPPGTILRLPREEHFLAFDYVHAFHLSALLGTNDPPERHDSTHQQAMCVVSGRSKDELDSNMRAVQREFTRTSLVAPTLGTKRQLRDFMETYEEQWRSVL